MHLRRGDHRQMRHGIRSIVCGEETRQDSSQSGVQVEDAGVQRERQYRRHAGGVGRRGD